MSKIKCLTCKKIGSPIKLKGKRNGTIISPFCSFECYVKFWSKAKDFEPLKQKKIAGA